MFSQQAALQTPSLQTAAKCPLPRSVSHRGECTHTSTPSQGSSHSPSTGGQLIARGVINSSWVMERWQQSKGGVQKGAPGLHLLVWTPCPLCSLGMLSYDSVISQP